MRSIPSARRLSLLLAGALALALMAAAPAAAIEVNLCGWDTQPPASPGDLNLADALAAGGTITFRCGGPAIIRITQQHWLNRSVNIEGGGQITLDGEERLAMFLAIAPELVVRLADLTVRRAGVPRRPPLLIYLQAGVIEGQDAGLRVFLHNTRIVGSHAPIRAGEGAVIAEDSDFDSNTETAIAARIIELTRVKIRQTAGSPMEAIGGTVTLTDSDISANGRSVFDQCQLSIVRTPFTANVAETNGPAGAKGGGALFTGCTTTIENSRFVNNRSSTGGAIYIGKNAPSVIIQGSRFEGNRATNNGGAIAMEPSDAVRRTLELVYITFKNNQAKMGGAIDLGEFLENDTLLDARGVTFTANAASSQGGAIAGTNAAVQIRRGLFLRNEAQWGGAIWLHKRAVRPSVVANTLFALNKAPSGTFVGDSTRFVNVTMVGSEGPGIVVFPYGQNTGRALRLANTIVENNSGDNCRGGPPGIVDEGDNVQFPGTSCGATIREAVALLDTFYAPIIGGAARAQGNEATCAAAPVQGHDV